MEKHVEIVLNAIERYKQGLITKENLKVVLEILYEVGFGKGYNIGYNDCEAVYSE